MGLRCSGTVGLGDIFHVGLVINDLVDVDIGPVMCPPRIVFAAFCEGGIVDMVSCAAYELENQRSPAAFDQSWIRTNRAGNHEV